MDNHPLSHKHQTTLLTLLIAGVVILGVLAILQNREIKRLASDGTKIIEEAGVEQQPAAGSGEILAKKTIQGPGFLFDVIHYCDGTVMTNLSDGVESAQFCLGENTLVFKDGVREKTISTETINSPSRAPLLIDVELVPTVVTSTQRLLISYQADDCRTTGNCGVGMPENWVSHVLNVADLTAHPLTNYPLSGDGVWNSAGTKALFILDTCGGAGCSAVEVVGYDLNTDKVKPVTTEKVIPPEWTDLKWLTDSKFSAVILNASGQKKTVTGAF